MAGDSRVGPTIRVPDVTEELHGWWHERVILRELELGWEDTSFKWRAFWAFDQGLPDEEVIFRDGSCGNAFWRVLREVLVLLE